MRKGIGRPIDVYKRQHLLVLLFNDGRLFFARRDVCGRRFVHGPGVFFIFPSRLASQERHAVSYTHLAICSATALVLPVTEKYTTSGFPEGRFFSSFASLQEPGKTLSLIHI